ncbi:hypothetical protein [Neisseria gonorrhoeae]|uniref:hypothetical protein n=1 Tax=Neisseria gonorrhoeae TaxID=485 RepID=UPI0020243A49|nr:hypothetical protein [Neisseria gonorrhoeae]
MPSDLSFILTKELIRSGSIRLSGSTKKDKPENWRYSSEHFIKNPKNRVNTDNEYLIGLLSK